MTDQRNKRPRVEYGLGTWFAVPLRQGGYCVGVVARKHRSHGVILTYLFGPRREAIPTLPEVERLSPESAARILRIGDLHLIDGTWPIVGVDERWIDARWPMPAFVRRPVLGGRTLIVRYADDDPARAVSEVAAPDETSGLEPDGLWGAGAVEAEMTELLLQ